MDDSVKVLVTPGRRRFPLRLGDGSALPLLIGVLGAVVCYLLCLWRWDTVPGLHIDEAWCSLRSDDILRGYRPTDGMNNYTGALPQYMMAQMTVFTKDHFYTVRLFGALCAALSFFTLWWILVKFRAPPPAPTWGQRLAQVIGALVAAAAPVMVCYFRFNVEITTLVPLLLCCCLMVALYAGQAQKNATQVYLGLLATVLGLAAVHTHLLAAASMTGIMIALVCLYRRRGLLPGAIMGVGLGAMALYRRAAIGDRGYHEHQDYFRILRKLGAEPLKGAMQEVFGLLDGRIPAYRYVGSMAWDPTLSADFVLLFLMLLGIPCALRSSNRGAQAMVLTCLSSLVFVLILIPFGADRYFQIPTMLLVFGLIGTFLTLSEAPQRWGQRLLIIAGLAGALWFNGATLWRNYFELFVQTGGADREFAVADNFVDTSSHFIDLQPMIEAIKKIDPTTIYFMTFIEGSARVLFPRNGLYQRIERLYEIDRYHVDISQLQPGEAAVLYKSRRPDLLTMRRIRAANSACSYDEVELKNIMIYHCRLPKD